MSFIKVTVVDLHDVLATPHMLIVDLRTRVAYASARIPHALCFSVPSTLLKRPAFSLDRLGHILPSVTARNHFATWRFASAILVYDEDSTAIPESSNICSLLNKFRREGCRANLYWLHGGFNSVFRDRTDLVDINPIREQDQSISLPTSSAATPLASSLSLPPPNHAPLTPFFHAVRQNIELSHGYTERIPLRLPHHVRSRISDLPFAWLREIARRSAPAPDLNSSERSNSEEEFDDADVEEGTEALAKQFYRIELAEQKRLMSVLERHSKESGHVVDSSFQGRDISVSFPFSITAGLEKGTKNRYSYIWPFEHARVRLRHGIDTTAASHGENVELDDYVNASYVQPLGTSKRYIATQGPLPATFTDFWTLCWEQNVHVIVMLTREVEGSTVKCGNYWSAPSYGPLRLSQLSISSVPHSPSAPATTIKRVFELWHTAYPKAERRRVVHLQYLEWSDMQVPEDPRGVLGLRRELERAYAEAGSGDCAEDIVTGNVNGEKGPVLLHCSAGVGRTGGFIAVDAVLDAVKREMNASRVNNRGNNGNVPIADESEDQVFHMQDREEKDLKRASTKEWACDSVATSSRHPTNWTPTSVSTVRSSSSSSGFPARSPPSPSSAKWSGMPNSATSDSSTGHAASSTNATSISEVSKGSADHAPHGFPDEQDWQGEARRARTCSLPSSTQATSSPSAQILGLAPLASQSAPWLAQPGHLESQRHGSEPEKSPSTARFSRRETGVTRSPLEMDYGRSESTSSTDLGMGSLSTLTYSLPLPSAGPRTRRAQVDTLSQLKTPILSVVQDMRTQRMSLCQSLRQYVFVHAAVVEGALSLVDEERQRARGGENSSEANAEAEGSPGRGKRMASATELVKEENVGGVHLAKRPSTAKARSKSA